MGSLALRPGDSLAILWMALSVGFIRFVSSTDATQATRLLTLALVGLTPTVHASLRWTHSFAKTPQEPEFHPCNMLRGPLYAILFKCVLNFGEGQRRAAEHHGLHSHLIPVF